MRRPLPLPRDAAEAAIATWAFVQVFTLLAERDRFVVLFSLDPVSLPWVAVLWAKNLLASTATAAAFVGLLRLTAAIDDSYQWRVRTRRGAAAVVAMAVAIGAAGVLARWALPDELPPGLWCDVAYEAEEALDSPEGGPLLGGVPLALDGRPSSTMVSNLYLAFCRGCLALFGQGEPGLRAVSAVPGTLLPLVGAALAVVTGGPRSGLVALALLSLCRWPVIFSYWTWTGSAVALLSAAAALGAAIALRRESVTAAAAAGLFTGLSFHTHPASGGAAIGLGLAALPGLGSPAGARRAAAGVAAAALAAAPFFVSFLDHPSRLGGRTRDVSVFSETRRAGVPGSVALRLVQNTVEYSGSFLFRADPNPRHGVPGRASANPVVGVAVALGAALALRRAVAGSSADLLLLALAAGGLLPGILANPGGAPNTTRSVASMVPLLLLATRPLVAWGGLLAKRLKARPLAVGGLGLALLLAFETTEVPVRWAADPLVASYFGPEETALGRSLGQLAPVPAMVAPRAVRDPIVLEACAAPPRPVAPLRRMPRRSPASLLARPPSGPFWYVGRAGDRAELRSAGFSVSRGTPWPAGQSGPGIAWVRPPRREAAGGPSLPAP